jgi:lactate dehydrogenase-like 2-hydroxyacid dehydrogenase
MKVLITDAGYSSLDIEADVLVKAGHELVVASCRTPQEVIEAAAGVDALLVQFAPITVDVFDALPQLRLVSRYGVGVDVVDTEAARDHGVWVCNVPDYGTTEVALHAVALLLALLRNVTGHDREVRAGHWDLPPRGAAAPAQLPDLWCCRTGAHRTHDGGAGSALVRRCYWLRPVCGRERLAEGGRAAQP